MMSVNIHHGDVLSFSKRLLFVNLLSFSLWLFDPEQTANIAQSNITQVDDLVMWTLSV